MRVIIVAADFEENLGAGMIAAVAEEAGAEVDVLPFNEPAKSTVMSLPTPGGRQEI